MLHYAPARVEWERAVCWWRDGDRVSYRARHSTGSVPIDWVMGGVRIAQPFGEKIDMNRDHLRLPWSVAPLEGKYYGTHVLDADGEEVAEFWDHSVAGAPSSREKAKFGDDWTEAAWADYCCDSHWENERDYALASAIVEAMNARAVPATRESGEPS